MTTLLAFVVGLAAVRLLVTAGRDLLRAPALARRNYRDRVVPTAAGAVAVLAVLLVEAGRALFGAFGVGAAPSLSGDRSLMVFACVGFAFLGFFDDMVGTDADRGLRGHLRALGHGRVTSGMVKMIGGSALALVLVAGESTGSAGARVVADAALIALAANLANLFDCAPGRAIKFGLIAWIPLALVAGTDAVGVALAPVVGAFAGLLGDDAHERLMLGDAGAYALGAALGLGVVLECAPTTRTVVLVVLAATTLTSEFVNLSRVIERVPPLRAFDQLFRDEA